MGRAIVVAAANRRALRRVAGRVAGPRRGSVLVWPKEISSIAAAPAVVAVTGVVYQPVQVVAGGGRRGARIPARVAAAATGRAGSRDRRRNGPAGRPWQSEAMRAGGRGAGGQG